MISAGKTAAPGAERADGRGAISSQPCHRRMTFTAARADFLHKLAAAYQRYHILRAACTRLARAFPPRLARAH